MKGKAVLESLVTSFPTQYLKAHPEDLLTTDLRFTSKTVCC